MIHEGILRFRKGRYIWWALILILVSIVVFSTGTGFAQRSGGTWQGYTLGTLGALLILWLSLLGIRKRRYKSRMGSVAGWTSAHVCLGVALIFVATLHSAAQFGWNIHTLAYILMCVVVLSGMYGAYVYILYPQQMAHNRTGKPRSELFAELYEADRRARSLADSCAPAIRLAVNSGIERTSLGGGVLAQIVGRDGSKFVRSEGDEATDKIKFSSNKDQQPLVDYVAERIPKTTRQRSAGNMRELLSVLSLRQALLRRISNDIRFSARLKIWLYIHVPLTIALLASLTAHIVSTFLYW